MNTFIATINNHIQVVNRISKSEYFLYSENFNSHQKTFITFLI